MTWICTIHGRGENAYKISVGKTEGKISLERCRRSCKYNIKMDLKG